MKKFVKILFKNLTREASGDLLNKLFFHLNSLFRGLGGKKKAHPVSQMSLNILSHNR